MITTRFLSLSLVVLMIVFSVQATDCKGAYTGEPSSESCFQPGELSEISQDFSTVPGYFIENRGQIEDPEIYFTYSQRNIAFLQSSILIDLENGETRNTIEITFQGANKIIPQGREKLRHSSNFFYGNSPSRWKTDVPNYNAIMYNNLYNGIDLLYTTSEQGLKYDFIIQPFTDPELIKIRYHNTESLGIDQEGRLIIETWAGTLMDKKPYSYQIIEGKECAVSSTYVVDGNVVSIEPGEYDPSAPLIIDPLIYSSFVGGGNHDHGRAVTLDKENNVYIAGVTSSSDFPTTSGCFDDSYNDEYDIFVCKLDDDGSQVMYSTFIGGDEDDLCEATVIDDENNVYVTGVTYSSNFPTSSGCFDDSKDGNGDVFAFKLSSDGSNLLYSTFIGGENNELGNDIVLDDDGNVFITGTTHSRDFPTTPDAYDDSYNEWGDVFICELDRDGRELIYSSYVGGGDDDRGSAIALDSENNVHVTGETKSSNFPTTTGCFDETKNKGKDIFVFTLDLPGSNLVYSTFVGGDGDESGRDIAVDEKKNTYITGETDSSDFPTTAGSLDDSYNGGTDVFVLKLNNDSSEIVYSTFLGANDDERGKSIILDTDNSAYVTGATNSSDFPITPGCFDSSRNGSDDAYICKLNHDGSSLLYSSFVGGCANDSGHDIILDSFNHVYVVGETDSSDFRVSSGCADESPNGKTDGFVCKFSLFTAFEHSNLDYVIVTDPGNVDSLAPLAEWKTQKGVPAQIFTTDSIYENFSGTDEAEKIRHFIQHLERTTNIDYLLLAGDVNTVPTRLAYDSYDDEYVATDTYYAFLNGSWDDNEDEKYGDFEHDNVTWIPDVYVGRLPSSDAEELNALVQNILDYEKAPVDGEWFKAALFAAAYSNYDEDRDHDDIKDTEKTDKAKLTFTIEDRFLPDNFTAERLYENEGLDPTDHVYDQGLTLSNLSESLNMGYSLVIFSGHGSKTATYRKVWKYDRDGDSLNDRGDEEATYEYFNMDVSPSNGEKMPFFFIEACQAGWFDDSSDCLAEHVIKNIGIGVVASSRASFYKPGWDPGEDGGGLNQGLNYRFWEQFFGGLYSPGAALYESKEDYANDRNIRVQDVKNFFNYNLFGDPEIPIWTSVPANFSVEFPETVVPRENELCVSIFDSFDNPVENATVTIMNDHIYLTGVSDESGELSFHVTKEINSSLLITVVKHNFLPFQGNIDVEYPPEVQGVSFSADTVSRNHTMLIYTNGTDDKDDEAGLECQLEFRSPSGAWTSVTTIYYDSEGAVWVAKFVPGTDFVPGNYSFRARLKDSDNGLSEWCYANDTVCVANNHPKAMELGVKTPHVYRNRTVTIYANGTDNEDEESSLSCEIQFRSEQGNWTDLSASFLASQWEANFTPPPTAECNFYDVRVRFVDTDGDGGEWLDVPAMIEVRNNIPAPLSLSCSSTSVCRTESLKIYAWGSDVEDELCQLECLVQYLAPGGMWRALAGYNFSGDSWEASFTPENDAELGEYGLRVKFVDKDGNESGWLETPDIIEVLNKVPTAMITLLSPNPANESELIYFSGDAGDDGRVNIFHWNSDIDGFLSGGKSFSISTLSNGTHTIYLKVKDEDEAWSEETAETITINGLPRAYIYDIETNPSLLGETVNLVGKGTDDGRVKRYVWRTDEKELYNGTWSMFSSSDFPVGTHVIYFKVQDDHGAWSAKTSALLVIHERPMASIDSVPPNPGYEGESILFQGHGTDDGSIKTFLWYSDRDGELSSSDEFSISTLTVGVHQISFRVEDNYGIWSDEESILVIINPDEGSHQGSTIEIEFPYHNSTVSGMVMIQGRVGDGVEGVTKVEVSIDGGTWEEAEGTDSWNYEWDSTTVRNGEYEIRVRVCQGEEHPGEAVVGVTVNNKNDDGDDGPGFELAITFVALASCACLFKKKRK